MILHIAADRNFWDGYGALKLVNVTSSKALANMALRTGATSCNGWVFGTILPVMRTISGDVNLNFKKTENNSDVNSNRVKILYTEYGGN